MPLNTDSMRQMIDTNIEAMTVRINDNPEWVQYTGTGMDEPVLRYRTTQRRSVRELDDNLTNELTEVRDILEGSGIEFITLAGGAPRDLYLNTLSYRDLRFVSDFDFFVRCQLTDISKSKLEHLGFSSVVVQSNETYEDDGPDSPNPCWVAKGLYKGLEINFIVHNTDISSEFIINNFGCSLSKFELDLDSSLITASKEAMLSVASKMLVFNADVSDHYKAKIVSYFPNYKVGSYQQAAMSIVDREINRLPKTT